jgi:hypothetical protein
VAVPVGWRAQEMPEEAAYAGRVRSPCHSHCAERRWRMCGPRSTRRQAPGRSYPDGGEQEVIALVWTDRGEASSWAQLPGWRRAGGDRTCLDGSRVGQLR